ncbi:MAG TPA: DUF4148 domain-containing protein [Albitalea sp.]|uniref:DUF4148 domain-containing protein n=1 Tax=Piscinibacter sp. TaxID=1903157 RepID=UPI002ED5AAB7
MKFTHAAVAVSLFATAATAMAVEATQWNPQPGGLTRAEVKAELARAAAAGELPVVSETYGGFDYAHIKPSTVTRAEVKTELARAAAAGELPVVSETYGGFDYAHMKPSTLTRAEVKAELARAAAAGELDTQNETYGTLARPYPQATHRVLALRKPHAESKATTSDQ